MQEAGVVVAMISGVSNTVRSTTLDSVHPYALVATTVYKPSCESCVLVNTRAESVETTELLKSYQVKLEGVPGDNVG